MDPFAVEVSSGNATRAAFVVGDALRDALVRPGTVVVRLVFGQDGAQVARREPAREPGTRGVAFR